MLQPRGGDRRLTALAAVAAAPGARLLAHRAERRATVAAPRAFVKVLPPGRAAAVARAHRQAAGRGVSVPPVMACDDAAGILALGSVRGCALHDLLGGPLAGQHADAVGRALRRFHDHPREVRGVAAPHGPAAEAAVLQRWLERLAPFDPGLHAVVEQAARPVVAALIALTGTPVATVHRDLHDKQVLVDGEGHVGLVDLDTLTRGDPAIDLANLAAHLALRALQGGGDASAHDGLRTALLEAYGAPASWGGRVALYERAAWLRLACVYAFRPRGPARPAALVALARELA